MEASSKEQLRTQWQAQFNKALQHDSWGQVVEAQEEYQSMAAAVAAKQTLPSFTSKEKECLHRIAMCLSARVQGLRTMNESITSLDMKALKPVFEVLFTGNEAAAFPIEEQKYRQAAPVRPQAANGEVVYGDAGTEEQSAWQQQQAVLRNVKGTVVCLRIDMIGLKDAQDYIDPFITILVADPQGGIMDSHDTPIAKERRPTHVVFENSVYLNVSLQDLRSKQAAIFFEFKHYKPKKKMVSTRCWAFMELSELKEDQEIVLEIYHKPTDLRKKSLKLHSVKSLYLHLFASFVKN